MYPEKKVNQIQQSCIKIITTYALILEGLVPSAPPTMDMLLILTSEVNLSHTKA